MDTNLLPTGAAHPGHGRPVASGQADPATTTTDATAADGSGAADEGVEISISAEAAAALADPATAEGPGKSGASPAHMARGMDYEGLATAAYKNFGQLVSAIARGLDVLGTEEPAADEGDPPATDETAAAPASDGTVVVPDTTDDGAVADTTEADDGSGETTDAAAEETAAPDPIVTDEVVVDTEEAIIAEVVDTEEAVIAEVVDTEEPAAETDAAVIDDPVIGDTGIVVEADSLEDTLLEALEEDGTEVV